MQEAIGHLGLQMAGWPPWVQWSFFAAYLLIFIAPFYLFERMDLRRRLPWLASYTIVVALVSTAVVVVTWIVQKTSPFDAQLEAMPAHTRRFIATQGYFAGVGLLVALWTPIAVWRQTRKPHKDDHT